MPKPELSQLNLGSIARGAALELFEKCLNDVAKNIADTDTQAEAARAISITFKFKPEGDRRTIHISTSAKTTLAGAEEHSSKAYIGKTTEGGVFLCDQDPRQDVLFDAPVKTDNLLDFGEKTQQA
jgi:hypothetical protein